jgi:hypothetical protein
MTQIFQDDGRHRHAQRGGKILHRHSVLLFLIGQKVNQAIRQILRAARLIELDRELFAIGHLAKICQVRTHDRYPISARQMGYSAATCRRRVRHYSNRRTLEKIRELILLNVAGELDRRIAYVLFLQRLHVSRSLRMIASTDHQLGVGKRGLDNLERLDH